MRVATDDQSIGPTRRVWRMDSRKRRGSLYCLVPPRLADVHVYVLLLCCWTNTQAQCALAILHHTVEGRKTSRRLVARLLAALYWYGASAQTLARWKLFELSRLTQTDTHLDPTCSNESVTTKRRGHDNSAKQTYGRTWTTPKCDASSTGLMVALAYIANKSSSRDEIPEERDVTYHHIWILIYHCTTTHLYFRSISK